MGNNKDFQNLMVLEQAREVCKEQLQGKYFEVIEPLVRAIEQVMAANKINHFEALKLLQDKTNLLDSVEKKVLFSAALMEIVEETNLAPLK